MNVFVQFAISILIALAASAATYTLGRRQPILRDLHLSRRAADRIFVGFACAYVWVFGTLSILRHVSFHSFGFDLGVFDQAIWSSLNGRLLELSIIPDVSNLVAQRFSPILIAFVPLYAVWDDPIVLLVVQTLALGVTGFPLYWYAREHLDPLLALAISLAFYLSPGLQYVNLYEFHEVALVAPLFAFGLYFLLHRRDKPFLVCIGLALLAKEEIAFSLMMFGAFIFLIQRRRRLGLALAVFGAVWAVMVLQVVLPFFGSPGTGYYYFSNGELASHRFDYLGSSPGEIAVTLLTRPDLVVSHLLVPGKIEYALHFLVPLSFLPLLGAEVAMLALPTIGISLLSDFTFHYSLDSHYAAPMLPILGFAAVAGVERILRLRSSIHSPGRTWAIAALILGAALASYVMQSPGPFAMHFQPDRYTLTARVMAGYEFMRSLPLEGVLVAQKGLAPHLTHRRELYEFPQVRDYRQADYLVRDTGVIYYGGENEEWAKWFATGYFETVRQQGSYILARRKPPANPLNLQFGDQMTLLGSTIPLTQTVRGGQTLYPIVEWRADQAIPVDYETQVSLIDGRGHVWASEDRTPQNGHAPTNRWVPGQRIGDQFELRLPPTMPPGQYRITLRVHNPVERQSLNAKDETGRAIGDEPVIATVPIDKDHSSVQASELPIEQPLYVDMGEVRFIGYVPPRQTIAAGELLQVGLYWRARAKPQGDYETVVQLRDVAGRVAVEQVQRPADGAYPTTLWNAGEVLLDWHDFQLPTTIPAGEYHVVVSLREVISQRELGSTTIAKLAVVR